jgi:hypothetical protein
MKGWGHRYFLLPEVLNLLARVLIFRHGCCVEEISLAEVDCGHIMYAAVH